MSIAHTRPMAVKVLVGLLVFLSISGFLGAAGMLADPSGRGMGLSPELLEGLPVNDFVLPGLFLLGVYGIGSLLIAQGLMSTKWDPWFGFPGQRTGRHWSWVISVAIGVVLLVWTALEYVLFASRLFDLRDPSAWTGTVVWAIYVVLAGAILFVAAPHPVRMDALHRAGSLA